MLSYIKDRFLRLRLERDEREIKIGFTVTGLIIIALLLNTIYLNFFIFKSRSIEPSAESSSQVPEVVVSPTPTSTLLPSATPSEAPRLLDKSTTVSVTFKDYYINLGSGSNQSTDWTDVAGTLTTVDLGLYQNIQEVRLETSVSVPIENGTISVRLFNKTDGYAVWNSERTVQAQKNSPLLISEKLIYDFGPRLYQIQMKSQLNILANLLQARLHVKAQ